LLSWLAVATTASTVLSPATVRSKTKLTIDNDAPFIHHGKSIIIIITATIII
jgi:hypothetical protein